MGALGGGLEESELMLQHEHQSGCCQPSANQSPKVPERASFADPLTPPQYRKTLHLQPAMSVVFLLRLGQTYLFARPGGFICGVAPVIGLEFTNGTAEI